MNTYMQIDQLKWAVYDWAGAISEDELVANTELTQRLDRFCRRLRLIARTLEVSHGKR